MYQITKTKILTIVFFIIIWIIQSCENPVNIIPDPPVNDSTLCVDTTTIPLLKNWLVPLVPGNYWEYKVESLFDEDTIPLLTKYSTWKILKDFYAFLECNIYETVIYDRGTKSEDQWVFWQDSTGFYSLTGFSYKDTLFYKNLLYKYPVSIGDQWKIHNVTYDRISQKFILSDTATYYSCIATEKQFLTPLGIFKCYVYYHRKTIANDVIGFYDTYDYVVPNIGLVGQEVFITAEEISDTISYLYGKSTLTNYQLNN